MPGRLAVLSLALALLFACAAGSVREQQDWAVRQVKVHAREQGYDPERVHIKYDPENTAWTVYWEGFSDRMTPEFKKWDDQIHKLWAYQVIPLDDPLGQRTLWVFVDKESSKIVGSTKVH